MPGIGVEVQFNLSRDAVGWPVATNIRRIQCVEPENTPPQPPGQLQPESDSCSATSVSEWNVILESGWPSADTEDMIIDDLDCHIIGSTESADKGHAIITAKGTKAQIRRQRAGYRRQRARSERADLDYNFIESDWELLDEIDLDGVVA